MKHEFTLKRYDNLDELMLAGWNNSFEEYPITLEELKERIKERVDEVTLLEILDITVDELVERFEDKIDDRFDKLASSLQEDSEEEASV